MAADRNANDRNLGNNQSGQSGGRERTIGEGMTSPDSTQVPLRADTGLPDERAIKGDRTPGDVSGTGSSNFENVDQDDESQRGGNR